MPEGLKFDHHDLKRLLQDAIYKTADFQSLRIQKSRSDKIEAIMRK